MNPHDQDGVFAQPEPEPGESLEFFEEQGDLQKFLGDPARAGKVARTQLKASGRVIARVTDGIYRRPASAFRELISNAWDADANTVTIVTDAPRFERMHVRDDGRGMSYATLARLLHNIGGSAKRHIEGSQLGVTSEEDLSKSPGGRPLIGKIGIGLFSVSQIARRFKIITKVEGESYRLVADVRLRAYSEDADAAEPESDDKYISGEVLISREHAIDLEAHGTDIVLEDIKPHVRDVLRDNERWRAVSDRDAALARGDTNTAATIEVAKPIYHSGWIEDLQSSHTTPTIQAVSPSLPWTASTPPGERMAALMDKVEQDSRSERPELEKTLDAYLAMMWTLGLSSPVEYIETHPFDLTNSSEFDLYWISNEARGQSVHVDMLAGETVRQAVHRSVAGAPILSEGLPTPAGAFKAFVDGVELKRPVRFKFRSAGPKNLSRSLLLVGSYSPNLKKIAEDKRGGSLSLEGYLFWTGRIVPKENNGVLVRIRGASGALFDSTFFGYQVSELTRLRQITSELYVKSGLDAALNIDRESFNYAHPHVQLAAMWLQRAVRQVTNRHKDLTQRLRDQRKVEATETARTTLQGVADRVWHQRRGSEDPPSIVIANDTDSLRTARNDGQLALSRAALYGSSKVVAAVAMGRDARVEALLQVLTAYGVMDGLAYDEQESLMRAILEVFGEV